jgi:hypothetical protein
MNDAYCIDGAIHYTSPDQIIKLNSNYYPDFQKDLNNFKELIIKKEANKEGASFVHFGDGDYFFLKKMPVGSATPGRRALSIPYNKFDISPFREGWVKADYHCVEYLEYGMISKLHELYPKQATIPTEFLYGLTMNKWFFKMFKGKIGLIGAKNKLDIIKNLMNYSQYREYLELDYFNDYIEIQQMFACDNLENTIEIVKEQLERANNETFIFLYGVGHVKSGLIHHLPKIKNAIYLDIGAGIDAIAGIIDPERPYAYGWHNYRMKEYDYSKIDLLNYNIRSDNKIVYI